MSREQRRMRTEQRRQERFAEMNRERREKAFNRREEEKKSVRGFRGNVLNLTVAVKSDLLSRAAIRRVNEELYWAVRKTLDKEATCPTPPAP